MNLIIGPQIFNYNKYSNKKVNNKTPYLQKFAGNDSLFFTKDNVSFKGNVESTATYSLLDFIAKGVTKNQKRYSRIAMTYLDILESVAMKLKDKGFVFDRVYCEQHPVKSASSYVSKIMRSKNFKVPDVIRATLYLKDPYDLDNLNLLLSEMNKRGYVVSDTESTVRDLVKRGYIPTEEELTNLDKEIMVPDLDIRLDHIDDITKLPAKFRYSLSKPQKSGYEDIQIRFIREFAETSKNKTPIQHELIILFGPKTAEAKHLESENVYNNLRRLSELNIVTDSALIGSDAQKAGRYIDLIKQMFTGKISQKLFVNAKNADAYDLNERIPIEFLDHDVDSFKAYFKGLFAKISSYYESLKKGVSSAEELKEVQKSSRHDKTLVSELQKKLAKSIDMFNENKKSKKAVDEINRKI